MGKTSGTSKVNSLFAKSFFNANSNPVAQGLYSPNLNTYGSSPVDPKQTVNLLDLILQTNEPKEKAKKAAQKTLALQAGANMQGQLASLQIQNPVNIASKTFSLF